MESFTCEVCGRPAQIHLAEARTDRLAKSRSCREHHFCAEHPPAEWVAERKRSKAQLDALLIRSFESQIAKLRASSADSEDTANQIARIEKQIEDVRTGRYKSPTSAELIRKTTEYIEHLKGKDMDPAKKQKLLAALQRVIDNARRTPFPE
jgi:hypothetical protein